MTDTTQNASDFKDDEEYIELWRMYQSGQFLHYLALREDWKELPSEGSWKAPKKALSIIGTVYQLTEVYEFLFRLTQAKIYDEGVQVSISLNNSYERQLWMADTRRVPSRRERKTGAANIEIPIKKLTKENIIQNSREMALRDVSFIFERFGWDNQPIETFKEIQEGFFSSKF